MKPLSKYKQRKIEARERDKAIKKEQAARAKENAVWEAERAAEDARRERAHAACQRALDASGEVAVYITFLPSEHGNGYTACVQNFRKRWREIYGHLRGIARLKEVIGASDKREAFAAEVIAFFQSRGVVFTDRPAPAAPCMALSLRTDFFFHWGVGLWIGYTDAERVRRLMENARYFLSRGRGDLAHFAATQARKLARNEFPSRERRMRMEALQQPCPAVCVPTPAEAEEAYLNLYVAHFAADRKAAA